MSLVTLWILGFDKVYTIVYDMIFQKLLSSFSESTTERIAYFHNNFNYLLDMPFLNKFFGLGSSYIRSTDFISIVLVNCGVVGLVLFTLLFIYPIIKLKNTTSIKMSLLLIYVAMMIAIPEFFYFIIWLFLSIGYKSINFNQKRL